MWKAGRGFRIGTSRTYTNRNQQTLPGPALRMNQEHADATWVVGVHPSDAEARLEETVLSLRYRIPTLPFLARRYSGSEGRSVVADQALLDRVFTAIDTESAGRQLLAEKGLSLVHPHFSAATTTNGARVRRRLTVSLCGDPRGAGPQHRISLFGYDDEGWAAVAGLGLSVS